MDNERFAQLVAAYGGRAEAWPAAERAGAEALLRADPAARRLAADARRLDGWLDTWTVVPATPAAIAPGRSRLLRLLDWLRPRAPGDLWRPALASALPVVLGFAIGIALPAAPLGDAWEAQERSLLGDIAVGDGP